MVKLGFIVEGATEKIILEKSDFFNYLSTLKIEFIPDVEDAHGSGNLLPDNIEKFTEILVTKGASDIIILTDLDSDKCITETKKRIKATANHIVVISIKEIEAWFLSDTEAIRKLLKKEDYTCVNPEIIEDPYKEIRSLRRIPIRSKPILADAMVKNGFSILKAAEHLNCNSAKYFLKKITELSPIG